MLIKIYMINGYSREVGQWEPELFLNKDEAYEQFKSYVEEYETDVDSTDDWYASKDDGVTWFSLEERTVS